MSDAGVFNKEQILKRGREVMQTEANAVRLTGEALGESFVQAAKLILESTGRLCITGMGKAGLVGHKIQATFASVGTLSYSLHPGEALHGDLGMVHGDDVVLALSKSGSSEVAAVLPVLKKLGCKVILITAKPKSSAAEFADCLLQIFPDTEACPLGLAPSSSTTAMLAIGDALALAVMEQRGFKAEDYAQNHPGGALGRSLMHVEEIMRTGPNCPKVKETDSFEDCFVQITKAPLRAGAAAVVGDNGKLKGFVTQGDIFRFTMKSSDPKHAKVVEFMTANPKRINKDQLVSEATSLMRKYSIDELPVVDGDDNIVGLIDIQDLIKEGFEVT